MSKTKIMASLAQLSAEDRAQIQAKLEELAAADWQDHGELTDEDKKSLDEALAAYEANPDAILTWDELQSRVEAKFRK